MGKINSPRTLLILDWDGTVAATDTLSLIAPSPEELAPYTEAYMNDYKRLSDELGPRDNFERMTRWLAALEDVEFASVKRVEDGGLFKGMSRQSMLERAADTSKLELQAGASDLLRSFRGQWGIISVGWSGVFIRAALEARRVSTENKGKQNIIKANEVEFDEDGKGTGRLTKHSGNPEGIRVAGDKLRGMKRMVDEWKATGNSTKDDYIVYVGDSETDLLCLLEADLGVIMNSDSTANKCERMGIKVIEGLSDIQEARGESQTKQLRKVKDFTAFLEA